MLDVFVGRQIELAFLHDRLDEASRRRPLIVFVEGAPGIGKTALMSRFLQDSQPPWVLWATGEEFESTLAYGLVEQLFRSVEQRDQLLARLAADRADAAVSAVVFKVGAELLDMLESLEKDGPVVVVIDDAHWADSASLRALAFALRRLRVEQVLTVICTRDSVAERLPDYLLRLQAGEFGVRLRLQGLEPHELRLLAAGLGAGPLSRQAAGRLHAHTRGNPLHARTLFEELSLEALHDGTLPLPAPRSFAMLVVGRLARCSPETERLVVATSVLGRCDLDLAAGVAEVERPMDALDEAFTAHLLEEQTSATERVITFPHPLIQAAVYRDISPARRSSLHARAAALIREEAAALRHRVAAATGTEAVLANEMAHSADQLAAGGAWSAAADTLTLAARLSPDPSQRAKHLLEAVEWMLFGGRTAEARALEATLAGLRPSARQRLVLGHMALVAGAFPKAGRLLADAWRRCDHAAEPALATRISGQRAALDLLCGHGLRSAAWGRRALATDPATAGREHLGDILLIALGSSGRFGQADTLAAALPGVAGPDAASSDGLAGRGLLQLWRGDAAAACVDLAGTLAAHPRHGNSPIHLLLIVLGALADAEYRLGNWDQSLVHGRLALTTGEDAEQQWLLAPLHAVTSYALTGRGEWAGAEEHVHTAAALADALGDAAAGAYAAGAAALLSATRGDPAGVIAAVEPLHSDAPPLGVPGMLPWPELYLEALIELGQLDEAERWLANYEALVRGHPGLRAVAWRIRGDLEAAHHNPAGAAAAYTQALHAWCGREQPLEQARLEVAYGSLLRRSGQRTDAARLLGHAHERLTRLSARPHLERCVRELQACGVTRAGNGDSGSLTRQERAVASLVVSGYSNRQVAKELVLSVKTVEFHLGNVFSKLGVRSRSQLTLQLTKAGDIA